MNDNQSLTSVFSDFKLKKSLNQKLVSLHHDYN